MEAKKFLIVGSNVRNVAESAKKAGFEVYALTKHVDADLRIYADRIFKIENEGIREVKKKAFEIAESFNAEIVWHSGYEMLSEKRIERIVNKRAFYRELEKAGFNFPEMLTDGERGLLKPEIGGGGEGIRISDKREKGYILQRFVEGIPCSVSVLSTGKEAVSIAFNRILSGDRAFVDKPFKYCGNITPYFHEHEDEMRRIAEELAIYFELSGNIGVDFIVSDDVYILEINPRFQGSLDAIEWATDSNLFRLHLKAMNGELEKIRYRRYAGRAVVFARRDLKVKNSPAGNPFFADVPEKNSEYRKGDPLVSVLASGKNFSEVYSRLVERKSLYEEITC